MSDSKSSASTPKNKTFKPRAGILRKSKAERDAHAKEEAEKAAVRAAAAAQAAGKVAQPNKASTSRKRDQTRDNRDSSQGVTSGVFGAGTGTRQAWRKPVVDGGRSEVLDGQTTGPNDTLALPKVDDGTSAPGRHGIGSGGTAMGIPSDNVRPSRTTQDTNTFESDDEPEEARRDIERIWVSSDEEHEVEKELDSGKGKDRASSGGAKMRQSGGLRPVRAPRTLADEQEAETDRKGERKIVKSSRMVVDDIEGYGDGEGIEIDDESPAEASNFKHDISSSPEMPKRNKPGRRVGARTKDTKLSKETVEERAERLRLNADMEKLIAEFTTSPQVKRDYHMEVDEEQLRPDGKLFLFQFPPLIPFLSDQGSFASTSFDIKQHGLEEGPTIKTDPDGPATTDDSPMAGPGMSKTRTDGILTANEPFRLPAGRVGKLKVHKSGKVTLDWGGTDMEVRYGTEVDFLQDVVLLEPPGQPDGVEDENSSSPSGATYAFGQVQKKMVVIPDWQKLYD